MCMKTACSGAHSDHADPKPGAEQRQPIPGTIDFITVFTHCHRPQCAQLAI